MKKIDIGVVITTYNEERNIEECIKSARLVTNQIVVVDTQSTDRTAELAKKSGAGVYTFPNNRFVEPSREFIIFNAKTKWVFILDADERINMELSHEVLETVSKTDKTYFKIPRKNIFAGKKWLRFGGWYPDYVIRLIKKDAFVKWPTKIHSTPEIKGEIGYLKNPIEHYFHSSLTDMVKKTMLFEDIESDLLFKAGRTVGIPTFFRKYFGELYRRLIKNLGFRDGTFGVIESMYQAFSKTITYLMLYEKKKITHL